MFYSDNRKYNFKHSTKISENAISDSCSLRNWQKWIFCRHGPEDWVRLSGGVICRINSEPLGI